MSRMQRGWFAGVALSLVTGLLVSSAALSQDSKPVDGSKQAAPKTEKAKPKGRVPNNFGKLDLTTAQREKIYAIQDDYDKKLDDLREQIKTLVAKRDADIDAVLTAEQKTKLEATRAEVKAKADAKKKETEAKKAEAEKAAAAK